MLSKHRALEDVLVRCADRIDKARQILYYCDITIGQRSSQSARQVLHASTYVLCAAAIEAFVTESCAALVEEINSRNRSAGELRLSLLAIACAPHLESLQQLRGLKMWEKRARMFAEKAAETTCVLNPALPPLDGGTIRPAHLATIWLVFGLPNSPLPSPVHGLALTDLADSRNALAHGNADPAEISGRKSTSDLLKLLDRLDDVVLNVSDAMSVYLDSSAYLR
jgi:hypothetical protein